MKKIFFSLIVFISNLSITIAEGPKIECNGLPGCDTEDVKVIEEISSNIITEMIKYVSVLAVIALMISGIMYMFSNGEEEKTKRAKTWIIWSLVAVILSITSYYIVSVIIKTQISLS